MTLVPCSGVAGAGAMNNAAAITIEFENVQFRVSADKTLLSGINLAVRRGETLTLLGRSGSGKTTCLKMINRLLVPTHGEVRVDGTPVRAVGRNPVATQNRLCHSGRRPFPPLHRLAERGFGAQTGAVGAAKDRPARRRSVGTRRSPEPGVRDRYPHQLSGGQRQRVGLARALAADPPILLMDEPFGALDPITRAELQMEFKKLQQKLGKTIVFVTHDVGEALLLGSRIGLMESGSLRGIYTPDGFLRATDATVKAYVDVFRAGQEMFRS